MGPGRKRSSNSKESKNNKRKGLRNSVSIKMQTKFLKN
jgi:hypothetical protein